MTGNRPILIEKIDQPIYWEHSLVFVRYCLGFILTGSVAFIVALFIVAPEQLRTARGIFPIFLFLLAAATWALLWRGTTRAAVYLLFTGLWTYITVVSFVLGGLHSIIILIYPLVIIMTGWLLGPRLAIILTALTVVTGFGLFLCELGGVLPIRPPTSPVLIWIVQVFVISLSAVLVTQLVKSYQKRLSDVTKLSDDLAQRTAALRSNEVDLIAAKQAAEDANMAKTRFLAAASHDLRQPLSALSLYVGMLKNAVAPGDARLVNNIESCVDSLTELLGDLLDVSKLDAGVVTPRLSDFTVDGMLGSMVSVHAAEAELKGLRLRRRRARGTVRGDRELLQRIVGNFLANAIRYTDKGGVLIAYRRHLGKRWIEVWDTGIGIPEHQTEVVFEEFRQLDNAGRNRGSGLGLAIAAKTAALLGLQIRLRSRPGRGSVFAIELPAEITPLPEQPHGPPRVARTMRISVVDDNAQVRQALVTALEQAGHEVVAAESRPRAAGTHRRTEARHCHRGLPPGRRRDRIRCDRSRQEGV